MVLYCEILYLSQERKKNQFCISASYNVTVPPKCYRMPHLNFEQTIGQLEKRKGGYFYLEISAEEVAKFEKGKATRLVCTIDQKVSYSCGLNHLGDGNFFIIVATRYMQQLKKQMGDQVSFEIVEDPNPLGVKIPEALAVLLEQDEAAKAVFEKITDGKKRSLIYSIQKVKDIDKQVQKSLDFLEEEDRKLKKKACV